MTVVLTFDLVLELRFLSGNLPISLKQTIAENKKAIYESLSPDLANPYLLVGCMPFEAEGVSFTAWFASDRRDLGSENQPLRVIHIEVTP